MLRWALLGVALLCTVSAPSFAQESEDIPPPASVDDAGVRPWLGQYIHAEGWTLFGADSVAVAFGGPDGVALLADGTLRATVRHEYYEQKEIGGHPVRSLVQTRFIDCRNRTNRVVSITLYEKSNLQGAHVERSFPDATWSTPQPGSLYLTALDRICAAPTEGERRN